MSNAIVINDRYKLINEVDSGNGWKLYTGQNNHRVPCLVKLISLEKIKQVYSVSRMMYDCEMNRHLHHPGIVKLLDFGQSHQFFYIVHEYIVGETLRQRIAHQKLTAEQILDYMRQLSDLLQYAHGNSIMPTGLRPENIIIDQLSNTCQVLEFGLNVAQIIEPSPIDTFKYHSPEQAGLIKRPIDARSDLYTLGIIAYELCTGNYPFDATDIGRLLHQMATKVPPSAHQVAQVPIALSDIMSKLIAKEPSERYQTASGVLFDLQKFSQLRRQQHNQSFPLGLKDLVNTLNWKNTLVGRQEQLTRLLSYSENVKQDIQKPVFISGGVGTGKSSLINAFQEQISGKTFLVLKAKCSLNNIPLMLFKSALGSLPLSLLRLPATLRQTLTAQLQNERFYPLIDIVPELKSVLPVPSGTSEPFHPSIILDFFAMLGSYIPVILIAEDLEYCDDSSFELLLQMMNRRIPRVLNLISFNESKDCNGKAAILLKTASEHFWVKLTNFSFEHTRILLKELLGYSSEIDLLTQTVYQVSSGNPLLIKEQLHELIEAGILTKSQDTWEIRLEELQQFSFPRDNREVFHRRLSSLHPDAKRTLWLVSLFGEEFKLSLVTLFCNQISPELIARLWPAINLAVQQHFLIRNREQGDVYKFQTRDIWNMIYTSHEESEREQMHLKIAEFLEQAAPYEVYQLAWQFGQTSMHAKAVDYLLTAGINAKQLYAYRNALDFFTQARSMICTQLAGNSLYERKLPSIIIQIHECIKLTAMVKDHIEWLKRAEQIALKYNQRDNLAVLYHHLAEMYHLTSDLTNAVKYVQRCLPLAEDLNKQELMGLPLLVLFSAYFFKTDYYTALEYALKTLPLLERNADPRHLCSCYGLLSCTYAYLGFKDKAIIYGVKAIDLATKIQNPLAQVAAYHFTSVSYNTLGIYDKGLQYAQEALAIAENVNYVLYQYCAYYSLGLAYDKRYDYPKANEYFYKAAAIIKDSDTKIGLCMVYAQQIRTLLDEQRFDEVLTIAEEGLKLSETAHQQYYMQIFHRHLSRYYLGQQDFTLALRYAKSALSIAEQLAIKPEMAATSFEYGLVLRALKLPEADQFIERSFSLFDELGYHWHTTYYQNRLHIHSIQSASTKFSATVKNKLEIASIIDISQLISSLLDLDELLPRALDLAMQTIGANRGIIFLLDEQKQPYVRIAHCGDEHGNPESSQQLIHNLVNQVLSTAQSVLIANAETDRSQEAAIIRNARIKSVICTPLTTKQKLVGVMYLDNHLIANLFSHHEARLMEVFAAQLSISIDNASAYQELKDSYRKVAAAEAQATEMNTKLIEAQAQLVLSEKMANLGQLISGVAHEFNTPVGVILSNLDMIGKALDMMEAKPDKVPLLCHKLKELLHVSNLSAQQLSYLVKSLRNFARVDEADYQQANIHEGIDTTITILWHELKHRFCVERDYQAKGIIRCHPNQINQVFLNLIGNAIQATPSNGTITIKTWDENEYLYVSIQDTGTGVKPEHLARIFEAGFTTKKTGAGVGLGLAIVHKIIHQNHNGNISVTSSPGEGTTFTIKLPY